MTQKVINSFALVLIALMSYAQDLQNTCWEAVIEQDTFRILLSDNIFNVEYEGDTTAIASYEISVDTFRIEDLNNEDCDSIGTYLFSISDSLLDFTLIEDDCIERAEIIDGIEYVSCQTTSIVHLNSEKIKIYPNPSNGLLNIESENDFDKILIFDQKGRFVSSHYGQKNIDISKLSNNIYFVRFVLGEETVTKKIIKF